MQEILRRKRKEQCKKIILQLCSAASFYFAELKWFNFSGIDYFVDTEYTRWYVIDEYRSLYDEINWTCS